MNKDLYFRGLLWFLILGGEKMALRKKCGKAGCNNIVNYGVTYCDRCWERENRGAILGFKNLNKHKLNDDKHGKI